MPRRRDGTGPVGYMTRRNRKYRRPYGMGYGFRRGYGIGCDFRRGYGIGCGYGIMGNYNSRFPVFLEDEVEFYEIDEKEAMAKEKELLEARLAFLNTQLDNLTEG